MTRVKVYYEDDILVGEVMTNHSLSVEQALELIGFDEQAFIEANGFDDIDYNDFTLSFREIKKSVTLYKETQKDNVTGEIKEVFTTSTFRIENSIFAEFAEYESLGMDQGTEYILPEGFEAIQGVGIWAQEVVFEGSVTRVDVKNVDGEPVLDTPDGQVRLVRA